MTLGVKRRLQTKMSRGTLKSTERAQVCGTANRAKIAQAETLILGSIEHRSVLDARGEEEIADEDVTWNVNVYDESSCMCSPLFKEKDLQC